ncbi:virulence protein [Eubacterium sp. F2]|uniref:virulence protein n=1 Tax=Eubacterium sp. F2 TaxID=3381348 RepID=UPI0039080CA8
MKLSYSVTGEERKDLVTEICRITGDTSEYQFMPTCAYKVGNVTIDKDGGVTCEDEEKLNYIATELEKVDFTPEDDSGADEPDTPDETENAEEDTDLTIEISIDEVNVTNLSNFLKAKGNLIKKSFGIDDLSIDVNDDRVSFPWFKKMPEPDEVKAYTDFITLLCKLSKEQSRVSSRASEVTNEKYAFRCFLLRLGFIGPDYKMDRKILLKNLSGNSAFRNVPEAKEDVNA